MVDPDWLVVEAPVVSLLRALVSVVAGDRRRQKGCECAENGLRLPELRAPMDDEMTTGTYNTKNDKERNVNGG